MILKKHVIKLFENKQMFYTIDGVPKWNKGHGLQTLMYCKDVDMKALDFGPNCEVPSIKQIKNIKIMMNLK